MTETEKELYKKAFLAGSGLVLFRVLLDLFLKREKTVTCRLLDTSQRVSDNFQIAAEKISNVKLN